MREIKFRMWDTRLKYFHELEDVYEILIGNLSHIFTNRQNSGTFWDREDFEKRFKITQYTGLKDKNGKEIYEGDIVKDACYGIGLVMWSDTNFGGVPGWEICDKDGISKQVYYGAPPDESSEIIGNIYENPELVEN